MHTVLITGGFGGIGRAICTRLAQDGYRLIILSHTSPTNDKETFVQDLAGKGHLIYTCDLTNSAEVANIFLDIMKTVSTLDVSIHTAVSPLVRKSVLDLSSEEFQRDFAVTVFGEFELMRLVAKQMQIQKHGHIIGMTTSSIEPGSSPSRMGGYLSGKAAMRELLRELAHELAPFGIRVNAVAPGFVPTALHRDLPEKVTEFTQQKNPFKRLTQPEDIAQVVSFLCSNTSQGIHGITLPVTSGDLITL